MTDDAAGHTETTKSAAAAPEAAEPAAAAPAAESAAAPAESAAAPAESAAAPEAAAEPAAAAPAAESAAAAAGPEVAAAKAGNIITNNFVKPTFSGIGGTFSEAVKDKRYGRLAVKGGTVFVGGVVAMHGLSKFGKDEEGNRHPVAGLIQTGAGAAAILAGLAFKGKGGGAQVGI